MQAPSDTEAGEIRPGKCPRRGHWVVRIHVPEPRRSEPDAGRARTHPAHRRLIARAYLAAAAATLPLMRAGSLLV